MKLRSTLALLGAGLCAMAKINIHVVPHSHDDVGWLKTVDQYFLGQNQSIYHAGVQYILSSMVSSLQENSARTFVVIEQAFFQRWYAEQTSARQAVVKQLVASNQLTFANGGWCMHDEANPDYVGMADQQTLGVRWIVNEFGPSAAPTVQWQLDPFGHSATQGSLFSSPQAGFSSVVWARISYDDRAARATNQTLEWVWQPSKSLGTSALTLAHTLRYHYSAPDNACFDGIMCNGGEAVNADQTLDGYNAPAYAASFLSFLDSYSAFYRGSEVLVLFGDDFNYEEAQSYFVNLDRLIDATNSLQPGGSANGKYNVFYSSPSRWSQAALSAGTSFPLRTDDLMPYADGAHSYWTGYYTSRAALKGYIRSMTGYQTVARAMQVLAGGASDLGPSNPLYLLERALAVAQHHDAVAGTSKQHVAFDYAARLSRGQAAADVYLAGALAQLTGDGTVTAAAACHLANVSICPSTEAGQPTVLFIMSPSSQLSSAPVLIPVGLPTGVRSWAVLDSTGQQVTAQFLPLSGVDLSLRARYAVPNSNNVQWLAFVPTVPIPAQGYATYFLLPTPAEELAPLTVHSTVVHVTAEQGKGCAVVRQGTKSRLGSKADCSGAPSSISNGRLTLTFDSTTGLLTSFADSTTGINTAFTSSFQVYVPNTGDSTNGQKSGAYIFRPANQSSNSLSPSYALSILTGPVVSQASQVALGAAWASQVYRLWAGASDVEVEWTVGPIDVSNKAGLEVVSLYSAPSWATAGAWDTDSNCREWQHRVRNARPSWNFTSTEPIAQNYVPVNCAIRLTDSASGNVLTVVTDRSQGGASIQDGSVEIMLHRRMLNDDGRGVGEALNEPGVDGQGLVVRGKHWVMISPAAGAAEAHRARMQTGLLGQGVMLLAPLSTPSPAAWLSKYKANASAVSAALPPNVHLVTLHSQGPKAVLVRLAHLSEVGEGALAGNATVALASLLAGQTITAAVELTLVASKPLADVTPVSYLIDGQSTPITLPVLPPQPAGQSLQVTLAPMQIRTFMCTLA